VATLTSLDSVVPNKVHEKINKKKLEADFCSEKLPAV
jgi:hypothetical protein